MSHAARTVIHRLVAVTLGLSLLVGGLGVASAQDATPEPSATIDGRFDIGGRSLYLRCTGSGSPTVVIESFPIGAAGDWTQVETGAARSNRVCIYDPAGFGLSDPPPPGVSTPKAQGKDLWALLTVAGVDGPYVLAGFVAGADAVLAYHRLYPTDVAGLVLVVPRGLDSATHDRFAALLPPADREAEMAGWTEGGGPEAAAEFAALPPGPPVPAIVIQGGLPEDAQPGWPAEDLDTVLKSAQMQVASELGARLVVADGVKGNRILTDAPEVVIDAIGDVVEAVRDPSSWQSAAATPTVASAVVDGRFDIGGRSMYLHCEGAGSPTVVLEMSGNGPPAMVAFAQVVPRVAAFTRVCAYDRLGDGFSDSPPDLRTAHELVQELRALLAAANEAGPFVLADFGFSVPTLLHRREHPSDIVGLVLVRPAPSTPDELVRFIALGFEDEAYFRGNNLEKMDWYASIDQLAAAPAVGPVPVAIIAAARAESSPVYALDELGAAVGERLGAELGAEVQRLEVSDTGHIEFEQPDALAEVVRDVVEAVRNPTSWQPVSGTPAA